MSEAKLRCPSCKSTMVFTQSWPAPHYRMSHQVVCLQCGKVGLTHENRLAVEAGWHDTAPQPNKEQQP